MLAAPDCGNPLGEGTTENLDAMHSLKLQEILPLDVVHEGCVSHFCYLINLYG